MNADEFQEGCTTTAIYPGQGEWTGLAYAALGLAGEAGEVANTVKKVLRDDGGEITQERLDLLIKELGDCAWYLSQACTELAVRLDYVLVVNLNKLQSRKDRGVLHGDGDVR